MKIIKLFVLILLLIPALTLAGEIFGTISKNGKPYAKQQVTIYNNDSTIKKSCITDDFGYFSITIKQVGKFKLKTGGAVTDVFSNNNPTGYTFILVQQNSKWQLIQK
jgi:hypothetical protein